jgi:hypothetical protein
MVEYARRFLDAGDAFSALGSSSRTTSKLPAYVDASLLFPYEAGLAFVEALRGRSKSWRAVDKVLRFRHPSSAEQILHLDRYAANETPVPVRAAELGPALGPAWRRTGASSVGEFDLRALFEITGGSPDDSAAAGWGGGRFELWRKDGFDDPGCPAPCISRDVGVMRLVWDTATDRAVADEALGKAFEKGIEARRLGAAAAVELWSSRGGTIGLAGGREETDVVLAPTASLTARVLERVARSGGRGAARSP